MPPSKIVPSSYGLRSRKRQRFTGNSTRRLVFGCANPKAGAVQTLYTIPTDVRLNHRAEVLGGVRADECAAVLSEFFKQLRSK